MVGADSRHPIDDLSESIALLDDIDPHTSTTPSTTYAPFLSLALYSSRWSDIRSAIMSLRSARGDAFDLNNICGGKFGVRLILLALDRMDDVGAWEADEIDMWVRRLDIAIQEKVCLITARNSSHEQRDSSPALSTNLHTISDNPATSDTQVPHPAPESDKTPIVSQIPDEGFPRSVSIDIPKNRAAPYRKQSFSPSASTAAATAGHSRHTSSSERPRIYGPRDADDGLPFGLSTVLSSPISTMFHPSPRQSEFSSDQQETKALQPPMGTLRPSQKADSHSDGKQAGKQPLRPLPKAPTRSPSSGLAGIGSGVQRTNSIKSIHYALKVHEGVEDPPHWSDKVRDGRASSAEEYRRLQTAERVQHHSSADHHNADAASQPSHTIASPGHRISSEPTSSSEVEKVLTPHSDVEQVFRVEVVSIQEELHVAKVWTLEKTKAHDMGTCTFSIVRKTMSDGSEDIEMTAKNQADGRKIMDFVAQPAKRPMWIRFELKLHEKPLVAPAFMSMTFLTFSGSIDEVPKTFRLGFNTPEEARGLKRRLEALTTTKAGSQE